MKDLPEVNLEPLVGCCGPTDQDRIKDIFEQIFVVEYAYSRADAGMDYDEAISYGHTAGTEAAEAYGKWLKSRWFTP